MNHKTRGGVAEMIFAALIMCFPKEFRDRFGADMRELFRDQLRGARRSGVSGVLRLWLSTIPSLTRAIVLEHRDAVRDARRRARTIPQASTRTDGMFITLTSDLRFAARVLRKSPVFTVVAVLAISLGTGAVATIFSGINALLLRPLPGTSDASRLVAFDRRSPDFSEGASASYAFYSHLRDRTRTLQGVAAWSKASVSLGVGGEGNALYGNIVSGNYFAVLGVKPAVGRFFSPDEDRTPLTHPVVVVSHAFWTTRLGGDSSVVGRPVTVNGHPYTLIGVTPPGFRGVFTPLKVDAWVPLMMQAQVRPGRDLTNAPWLWMFGRLRDGTSRADAHRELGQLTSAWAAEMETGALREYRAIRMWASLGLPDDARSAFLGFASLLLGAAGLVLFIASVNVASMLSARGVARRREMALRTALGAARSRLVRQLLTESLLLFVLGALGGVAVAWIATGALELVPIPGDASVSLELSPDPRVFAFALLISLGTGLVFGLAPALRGTRNDITTRLRQDSASSGTRRTLMGNVLVVGQLAVSLVLLVSAGLFIRALAYGARIDPGFDTDGVATAVFNTESWGYDDAKGRAFYTALREQIEGIAGVTAVSFTNTLPLTMTGSNDRVRVDGAGAPGDARDEIGVGVAQVDAEYFDALRIPLLRGRAIERTDDDGAAKVIVVNEALARRLWPDGSAVGRTLVFQDERVTIVGVARNSKHQSLSDATQAFVYIPMAQLWRPHQSILVRTAGDAASLASAIQAAVRAVDAGLPRPAVRTLREETSIVLLPQRVAAMVTGVLGGVGLLLALVGLYGVIAYSVTRRTREIGVRVALGAQRSDVLRLVLREGMGLAVIGVVAGALLAAGATRLIAGFLFAVDPLDGATFAGMSGLLILVALLASYVPARRAARSDPMVALRSD